MSLTLGKKVRSADWTPSLMVCAPSVLNNPDPYRNILHHQSTTSCLNLLSYSCFPPTSFPPYSTCFGTCCNTSSSLPRGFLLQLLPILLLFLPLLPFSLFLLLLLLLLPCSPAPTDAPTHPPSPSLLKPFSFSYFLSSHTFSSFWTSSSYHSPFLHLPPLFNPSTCSSCQRTNTSISLVNKDLAECKMLSSNVR